VGLRLRKRDELKFSEALWTKLKERMKQRRPDWFFLSRLAMDIIIALKIFAGSSDYILPSPTIPMRQ